MVTFVLGGGGSRGALQVGALEVLIQAGIVPAMLVGTSVGAVNALAVALDPTSEGMRRLVAATKALRPTDVVDGSPPLALWNMVRGNQSLFSNVAWLNYLRRYFPDVPFADLQRPAYAIATNLDTGATRVFGDLPQKERILDGLMASTALAPFYPAWTTDDARYTDGATKAVLPLRQAIDRGARDIIAFNLTCQQMAGADVKTAIDVLQHSLDLMLLQQVAGDIRFAARFPGVRLTVLELTAGGYVGTLDTAHTDELIVRGRQIARAALPRIRATHFPSPRRLFPRPEWWPARRTQTRSAVASLLPWSDQW